MLALSEQRPKRRAVLGDYYTTGEVADRLGWSADTIRRHLVPIGEFTHHSGKIPYRKRGDRYMIPAWWLRSWIEDAHNPPPEPDDDDACARRARE